MNRDKVRTTNALIDNKRALAEGDDSVKKVIDQLESELRALNLSHSKASQIRSHARWIEEGEKPSKFSFTLEATHAQQNSVRSIYNSAGNEVSSQQEIQQAHFAFYHALYSQEPVNLEVQQALLNTMDVVLADDEHSSSEGKLLLSEMGQAMRNLSTGKTPGSDGLPQEFYAKFWDLLGPHLLRVYNFSLEAGSFSKSMQKSVTRLLYKIGDCKSLKNWRPISLLNVD